jgi:hypothetical protein
MKGRTRAFGFQSMPHARAVFLGFGVSRGRVFPLYLHAASAPHQVTGSSYLARSSLSCLMAEGQFEWQASILSCLYRAKARNILAQPPFCGHRRFLNERHCPFLSIFVQIAHLRPKILFPESARCIFEAHRCPFSKIQEPPMSHLQCLSNHLPSLPGAGARCRGQKQENNHRDNESR